MALVELGYRSRQAARGADTLPGDSQSQVALLAGQAVEVSCRIAQPSQLPPNARLRDNWTLVEPRDPARVPRGPGEEDQPKRAVDAFEIYTPPTPDWSKVLHGLDADVYLVYRAPVSGTYALAVEPEEGPVSTFQGSRWREEGKVDELLHAPRQVAWPEDAQVDVEVSIRPLDLRAPSDLNLFVETEPNDTPEQAQRIQLRKSDQDYTVHVTGGSDDVDYVDNGQVGASGDDWFRLDYEGSDRRLLKACLAIPDQQVAARIRCYSVAEEDSHAEPGQLLPIEEYTSGKNPNERGHQQNEAHRHAAARGCPRRF